MRKWWIAIAIFIALIIGAGLVYWIGIREVPSEIQLRPDQRLHLQAEAKRLVARRGSIGQLDAAWIADRLDEDSTAEDLARLGEERMQWLKDQQAAHLQREFPQLWDAWDVRAKEATGTNGTESLFEAGRLVQPLLTDERFRKLFDDGGDLTPALRSALIAETERATTLVRQAAGADHLVWTLPRRKDILDDTPTPAAYYAFRVLPHRVRLMAQAGRVEQAVSEMDVLMDVFSRVDWNLSMIGTLVHVIVEEQLLKHAALPLVEKYGVSPVQARTWLNLAAESRRDVVFAVAVGTIEHTRVLWHDTKITFAMGMKSELTMPGVKTAFTVEEIFDAWHRHNDWCFECCSYAVGRRASLMAPEGQLEIATALRRVPFRVLDNFRDDVAARLKWAALNMRIAEREAGPLKDHADVIAEVLKRWPGLSAAWDGDTLQVSCSKEYMFGMAPEKPLFELPSLK